MAKEESARPMMSDTEKMTQTLYNLETELEQLIQDAGIFQKKRKSCSQTITTQCDDLITSMRAQMRAVRRFRNYTDKITTANLNQISHSLSKYRSTLIDLRIKCASDDVVVIQKKLENVDDTDLLQEKMILDKSLQLLKKEYHRLNAGKSVKRRTFSIEDSLNDMDGAIQSLNTKLASLYTTKLDTHELDKRPGRVRYEQFEDHPLVNNVLQCISKARLTIQLLKRGAHIMTDAELSANIKDSDGRSQASQSCAGNDVEVLKRQITKLEKWRSCVEAFSKDDVEEAELIVLAIQRHVRSNAKLDNASSDSGSKSDSGSMSNSHHGSLSVQGGNDDTSDNEGHINERLI